MCGLLARETDHSEPARARGRGRCGAPANGPLQHRPLYPAKLRRGSRRLVTVGLLVGGRWCLWDLSTIYVSHGGWRCRAGCVEYVGQ
eukprot:3031839-Pyramimonas_sp.AAC.3